MSQLLYYLFLKPVSMLPMSVLHGVSTGVFYLMYFVIGYRKKVVRGNMERSFPDKSAAEIEQLMRLFYRHFCDLILESVRMFSMGEAEIKRRTKVVNPEVLRELEAVGKGVILVAGHYNSWEMMGTAFPFFTRFPVAALYGVMKDPFMDKVLTDSRQQHGLQMVSIKQTRQMFEDRKDIPTLYLFGADQSPTSHNNSFWMEFLNQDTAIAFGTEKFAKLYDLSVVFADIQKVKRGEYTIAFEIITTDANAEAHGHITRQHVQMLERLIVDKPQYWLWTHRRWKRKRENA